MGRVCFVGPGEAEWELGMVGCSCVGVGLGMHRMLEEDGLAGEEQVEKGN